VYSDTRDNIIGVLNIYDVLLEDAEVSPASFITPAHFLNDDRGIFEALLELQRRHQSIAFVRNAAGQCIGLVTVKDLVEEIVGELEEW
jgi:CBS domain containing-hemolysin-like protein